MEQKEELSDIEALDIAFIPKFISKESASFITESLSKAFKGAKIKDDVLKRDVGVILAAMIIKNVDETKQQELMEDIDMKQIDNKIKILAKEEYGDEIRKAQQESLQAQQKAEQKAEEKIKKAEQENNRLKEGLEKLNKIPNLDSEAKKVVKSLLETVN